jgi:hypothetical protein
MFALKPLLAFSFVTILSIILIGCGRSDDDFFGIDTSSSQEEVESKIKEINASPKDLGVDGIKSEFNSYFEEGLLKWISTELPLSYSVSELKKKFENIYGEADSSSMSGFDFTIKYKKYNTYRSNNFRLKVLRWPLENGDVITLFEGEDLLGMGHNLVYTSRE